MVRYRMSGGIALLWTHFPRNLTHFFGVVERKGDVALWAALLIHDGGPSRINRSPAGQCSGHSLLRGKQAHSSEEEGKKAFLA